MVKKIVLTPTAEADLLSIDYYLTNNWGHTVAEAFLIRFQDLCSNIAHAPDIYSFINREKEIRKCVLTKQNIVCFRERAHEIEVICIFDTRQDPDKLSGIIESFPKA